jgi:hypothetical protein
MAEAAGIIEVAVNGSRTLRVATSARLTDGAYQSPTHFF